MNVSILILRELSPLDRYRYSLASKEAYDAVSSFNRQAYRVHHILSPYFTADQIDEFRLIQLETDFVISGSAALQFFDLSTFEDSDLDLYIIRAWDTIALLAGFLLGVGYDYAPRRNQPRSFQEAFEADDEGRNHPGSNYNSRGTWGVYSFVRESDRKKIQIISCRSNLVQVILEFHSTCVMNIISYTHAYALYPYTTYVERLNVEVWSEKVHRMPHKIALAFEKYRARGWNSSPTPSRHNALRFRSEFRDTARCLGDSACWTIPLAPVEQLDSSIRGFNTIPSLVNPLCANSWYTLVTEFGDTQNAFELLQIYDRDLQKNFAFTFASTKDLDQTMLSTACHLGETVTAFCTQR
ncbi:hypothetical protein EV361DRAFT_797349 [Lentinula raphanica]|uniref:Uncharacterized protein n=1 Tax=Lentinula raphanica TaxID=153919 RepID=A0AA38P9J3_9AGAR|nr:hypothetical protein F5878DRAFT_537100 [Lentinula raphanica]KAJ3972828.1 hypothetical protein EV361DRAFT_797349 [Lentinula raphanica]